MTETNGLVFANRCLELPVVNSTCFLISNYYNRLKNKNTITKCSIQLAETTIKTSINIANPILNRFTNQVQALDGIACKQLNKLEAAFPIILEDTDKIVNHGKDYFSQTMIPAVHDKINNIKESTQHTCKAVKTYGLNKVEAIRLKNITSRLSNLSDKFLDNYMLDAMQEDAYFRMKIRLFMSLVYTGVQTRCTKNINCIIRAFDKYLISLIDGLNAVGNQRIHLKQKLDGRISFTKSKIDVYRKNLAMIIRQLSVQDGRSIEQVNSFEERSKIIIRRSFGNLLTALNLMYTKFNRFPQFVHSSYSSLIESFYLVCARIKRTVYSSPNLISNRKEIIKNIEAILNEFFMRLSQTAVVTWLVPNFDAFGTIDEYDTENMQPELSNDLDLQQKFLASLHLRISLKQNSELSEDEFSRNLPRTETSMLNSSTSTNEENTATSSKTSSSVSPKSSTAKTSDSESQSDF